jgi:hypothetical protein
MHGVFAPFQVSRGVTIPDGTGPHTIFSLPPRWTNIVGVASSGDGTQQVNGNDYFYHTECPVQPESDTDSLLLAEQLGGAVVPSAFSVQVMNPEALQTTNGVVSATVSHTPVNWGGSNQTWGSSMARMMGYMRPRLLSAGKLALRGVQLDAYPLDMNKLSEFTPIFQTSGHIRSQSYWGSNLNPCGFSPIAIYNPNEVKLQLLITVEWRTRFTVGNPAVAAHVQHKATPDSVWDGMIKRAVAMGNGVKDIVETVASIGEGANAVMNAFGRSTGGRLPMIVD